MDVGALTPFFFWAIREREKIMDLYDVICGARFTTSYTRIGGVAQDISDAALASTKTFVDEFIANLNEVRNLVERNKIFIERCEGIGYLSKEDSIELGLTGPLIRACGVARDLRINEPYLFMINWISIFRPILKVTALQDIMSVWEGLLESTKIIQQCLEKIPSGQHNALQAEKVLPKKERVYTKMEELIHDFMIINFGVNPPKGESYSAIEASKGELGFYFISDGSGHPWRLKIRSPKFL